MGIRAHVFGLRDCLYSDCAVDVYKRQIVITDYSSIVYEAYLLGKLVGFYVPEMCIRDRVYMMENVERERIERELSDSLQLLQIEYESKFGVGVSGLADR